MQLFEVLRDTDGKWIIAGGVVRFLHLINTSVGSCTTWIFEYRILIRYFVYMKNDDVFCRSSKIRLRQKYEKLLIDTYAQHFHWPSRTCGAMDMLVNSNWENLIHWKFKKLFKINFLLTPHSAGLLVRILAEISLRERPEIIAVLESLGLNSFVWRRKKWISRLIVNLLCENLTECIESQSWRFRKMLLVENFE